MPTSIRKIAYWGIYNNLCSTAYSENVLKPSLLAVLGKNIVKYFASIECKHCQKKFSPVMFKILAIQCRDCFVGNLRGIACRIQ